jgi:hypothetical protein
MDGGSESEIVQESNILAGRYRVVYRAPGYVGSLGAKVGKGDSSAHCISDWHTLLLLKDKTPRGIIYSGEKSTRRERGCGPFSIINCDLVVIVDLR